MEYEILLSVYFLVIWLNHSWRNWNFFSFNSPARDAALWFSGRVSNGAAVVCGGDKEGSGLRSPRDAPLNSCALHWAHPASEPRSQ